MTTGEAKPDVPDLLSLMQVEVSQRFVAAIEAVWELLSDVERMAGLGPEHVEASWATDDRCAGAMFNGKNRRDGFEWEVPCYVTESDPLRRFAWAVLAPDNPSSRWLYTLSPEGTGTIVTQRFQHGPNYSFIRLWAEENPAEAMTIIERRSEVLESDMRATLAAAARLVADNA